MTPSCKRRAPKIDWEAAPRRLTATEQAVGRELSPERARALLDERSGQLRALE